MKNMRKDIMGLSQEKLAEDIDMSRSFLSQLESPNVDVAFHLIPYSLSLKPITLILENV